VSKARQPDRSLLSHLLSQYIQELGEPDEEFPASEDDRRILPLIASLDKKLLDSRYRLDVDEALLRDWDRALDSKGLLAWHLDDHYSRRMVGEVQNLVRRTLKLQRLVVARTPAAEVNVYLAEATRCYVFGLWQASVALARSALEVALRDKLPNATAGSKLLALMDAAQRCRVLDDTHLALARQVQEAGNRVLHGKPITATVAEEVLFSIRCVLLHMYVE
jgi:hypothetical protein